MANLFTIPGRPHDDMHEVKLLRDIAPSEISNLEKLRYNSKIRKIGIKSGTKANLVGNQLFVNTGRGPYDVPVLYIKTRGVPGVDFEFIDQTIDPNEVLDNFNNNNKLRQKIDYLERKAEVEREIQRLNALEKSLKEQCIL